MTRQFQRTRKRTKQSALELEQLNKLNIDQIPTGPGHRLRIAREALNLSREDVAGELRLGKNCIIDIEKDKYEQNIPVAFMRGYLRSYAKLVKISANDIIEAFDELMSTSDQTVSQWSIGNKQPTKLNEKNFYWFGYGIVFGLICLLFIWWKSGNTEHTMAEINPVDQKAEEKVISATNQEEVEHAKPKIVEANYTEIGDFPSQGELAMVFTDQCWIEVKDATGEKLYMGLKSKGDKLNLQGKTPFKVLLGNPRAIDIVLNDKKIDLSTYVPKKTARVTVG